MCRVLAERKLVVGGWTVIVWKACKRPTQYRIHGNEAKTEREGEKKAEREQERKKKSYEALTDDLTGETEFVFCREMSDALPVREREMERERQRERPKTHHRISLASFSPSSFSSGLRRLRECNNIKGLALRMYIVVPVTTWNRQRERWRKAQRDGASSFSSFFPCT